MHFFPDEARVKYLIGLTSHILEDQISEKVEEAPTDGYQYVRKGGKWVKLSGGGGGGGSYVAGPGIDISDDNIISVDSDAIASKSEVEEALKDATLSKDITAQTTVGYLEKGTVIKKGTSFAEFVELIVNKELGVIVHNPVAKLTMSGNTPGIYEMGTRLTVIFETSFVDGYFAAEESWGDDQTAGCKATTTTCLLDGTEVTYTEGDIQKSLLLTDESTHIAMCRIDHTKSSQVPVSSKGNPITDAVIPAGTVSSSQYKYYGRYRAYIATLDGDVTEVTSDAIETIRSGQRFDLNPSGDTKLYTTSKFTVPGNKKTTFIAIPTDEANDANFNLTSIQNEMGLSYLSVWTNSKIVVDEFPIANGAKRKYTLFKYYNASSADVTQTKAVITRL